MRTRWTVGALVALAVLGVGLSPPVRPILGAIATIEITTAEAASNPTGVATAPTLAVMKALGPASGLYPVLEVLGYNAPGDGSARLFLWNSASTATAEPCVTYAATGVTTGRWLRQLNGGPLSVLDCGADASGTTLSKVAFQAASDLVNTSVTIAQQITVPIGTFDLGTAGTFGVETNAGTGYCPLFTGQSFTNTIVEYNPSTEGAAFLFNSANGQCYGGGVENLRVSGNSHTDACEFLSTGEGHCFVQGSGVSQIALLCSCTSGGFSEDDKIKPLPFSTFTTRLLQYHVANSGSGSFRESGLVDGSIVSVGVASANCLVQVDSSAVVYSAPMSLSINYQPGSTGGTICFINAQGNGPVSVYGSWQIEVDGATNPAILQLAKNGQVVFGGSTQFNISGDAQLVYGPVLFANQAGTIGSDSYKSAYEVLENAASAVQYLTAGTGAVTNVAEQVTAPGTAVFSLSIYNGSTYNWNGQVLLSSSALGQYSAVILGGHRFFGSNDPVFGVTGTGLLTITMADAVLANSTRIFGVITFAGEQT